MDHSLAKDLLEVAGFEGLEQIEQSLDLKYVQIGFDSNQKFRLEVHWSIFIPRHVHSVWVRILVGVCLKAQQVSWLHSVVLRLKFLCLSLISAVMSIKCPICQLLFVVVVLVNCFLCLFLLPLFSAVFVSSVTSLHRLINHKALYLLYLVDRNQAREKWSHGFFHLGLRVMSIIKSQNA